ncbi:helix-turn-helix transcriptional regulator [Lysobacter solisilvae (ex Woo and Kim 2020)]|uniref:Helix-turn-helix transcriptional regulator n=1 Tax=Agrilutibacter terrestris TaxID=2865112 RepID=A0A7H0FZC4_9GAMM|nr:helix-turn-helix transcriptional regulator [Lysobacter terrestris]QNP41390.1 helix-turn-helix transcriptional regulator [Lysobacter terrestris]
MNDKATGPTDERRLRRERDPDQLRWIAQARCLAAALDLLAQPIVLLLPGEPLRVWHANAAARHRFSSHPELRLRDGTLMASPTTTPALTAALARVLELGPGHPCEVRVASAGESLVATVQALDFGAAADLPVREVVMLELHQPASVERGLHRLCSEFHLTRKEAEAAVGLYSMGSIDELARCTGRSVHTVRTQLKAAMHKTATHTQAGLVALVANRLAP